MGLGGGARVQEEHGLMTQFQAWVTEGMLVLYTEGDGKGRFNRGRER